MYFEYTLTLRIKNNHIAIYFKKCNHITKVFAFYLCFMLFLFTESYLELISIKRLY